MTPLEAPWRGGKTERASKDCKEDYYKMMTQDGPESGRGWITEEAFFTVSPSGQQMRQRKEVKMNHLSPAEKHEFQKSMEIEWQALLKNQAARVLSLEETVQARARWP